jgi:hypothetical protein
MVKFRKGTLMKLVPSLSETSHEGKVNVLWNQQLQTDRTMRHNKPGIMSRDRENDRRCFRG